jgi:hypothetical protein
MAAGRSIHIGLNAVDPDGYEGWDGQLVACEFDANDMAAIADEKGFESRKLLTSDATSSAILDAIGAAGEALNAGDILFLTYSGHGGQVPDANSEEEDRMDETWCAFDRQIVDDELYSAWSAFKEGTRLLVLSDSCHSGTVARVVLDYSRPAALAASTGLKEDELETRMRAMPAEVGRRTYQAHKAEYDEIQRNVPAFDASPVAASVLLISGCQDNQTSADGAKNGLFTQTLLEVWDGGKWKGSYRRFAKRIVGRMPPYQTPNLFTAGTPSAEFERQQPFAV